MPYVRRRIHGDHVVAEVFLVAWRRFGELPEGKALAWLYGVARRTLANAYRSDEHRLRVSEWLKAQPHDEGGDHTEDVALRMEMASAFDALSEADQEVLRLALWDEVASSQGAKILGCGVGAYQVRLHRARKRLKDGLALRLLDGTAPQWDALVGSDAVLGDRCSHRGRRGESGGARVLLPLVRVMVRETCAASVQFLLDAAWVHDAYHGGQFTFSWDE